MGRVVYARWTSSSLASGPRGKVKGSILIETESGGPICLIVVALVQLYKLGKVR